ncbi:hypothetical protein HPP92_011051 [Vanilla planifolia]|uniref:Uncharacterized protein n=1 Tax=Vanilla planifolia TaxID=51239 RepID=A0A835RBN0_VANPL|nr:hypothetical protein HPP92_011051 [Vanilla planifolia]
MVALTIESTSPAAAFVCCSHHLPSTTTVTMRARWMMDPRAGLLRNNVEGEFGFFLCKNSILSFAKCLVGFGGTTALRNPAAEGHAMGDDDRKQINGHTLTIQPYRRLRWLQLLSPLGTVSP